VQNLTIAGLFMYFSYLILFTKFFFERYSTKNDEGKSAKKQH